VVEADERFGDPVRGAVLAEHVRVAAEQPGVFEDVDGMGDVGGPARQITGHAAPGGVAVGDGREDGQIQGGVAEIGLLGQQVTGLTEERCLRIEHRDRAAVRCRTAAGP
jgi:hypothetical protein